MSDPATEVRKQLSRLSKKTGENTEGILVRYVLERLLAALGRSGHRDRFIVKGALLFYLREGNPLRPTRDLDLSFPDRKSPEQMAALFAEVARSIPPSDGIVFNLDSIQAEAIREGRDYEGVRLVLWAAVTSARIRVQIDVGFGDAVAPRPVEETFRTLLPGSEPPRLLAYPNEAIVAEKLQAMLDLGLFNSRMKDYFDLDALAKTRAFDGESLALSIKTTFDHRRTAFPEGVPLSLSGSFANDRDKLLQWEAFLKGLRVPPQGMDLASVVERVREFVSPVLIAGREKKPFYQEWAPGGPWREKRK